MQRNELLHLRKIIREKSNSFSFGLDIFQSSILARSDNICIECFPSGTRPPVGGWTLIKTHLFRTVNQTESFNLPNLKIVGTFQS